MKLKAKTPRKKQPYMLSIADVLCAALESDYIMLISATGNKYGINSKAVTLQLSRKRHNVENPTRYIKVKPITFHEYITLKIPFLCKESDI